MLSVSLHSVFIRAALVHRAGDSISKAQRLRWEGQERREPGCAARFHFRFHTAEIGAELQRELPDPASEEGYVPVLGLSLCMLGWGLCDNLLNCDIAGGSLSHTLPRVSPVPDFQGPLLHCIM